MTDNTELTYEMLVALVLFDPEAQQTCAQLQESFPNVPRPFITGSLIIGCCDDENLRLDALMQFISMLDAIFEDPAASMGISASLSRLSRELFPEDGTP